MGSDSEPDPYPLPKLRLLSEPSGASTPPLHTTATVPFRWEEHPGKPRPCTDIIISTTTTTTTTTRSLELPPRLTMVESNKITKTSSPTTVLDGPTGRLLSSSFRFEKERRRKGRMQGSFDSSGSGGWSPNDEGSGGGPPEVVAERGIERRSGGGGCRRFGSFRVGGGGGRRVKGGVVVSPSPETGFSGENDGGTMKRNNSLSKVTRAHFWATIYEGFKHVVPWRKKSKKESFTL